MQINWFEILAQIINFFIILFILQKLLYKPVMAAMETRQERILKSQIQADEEMARAKELMDEYSAKMADIDQEKREILDEARKDAEEKRDDLLEDYKLEAEAKRKMYLKEVEDEKDKFMENLAKRLGENAVKISSHILSTISSRELEDEVFKSFTKELESLRESISDDKLLKDQKHLNLSSAREMTQDEKNRVEEILRDQIESFEDISYEVDSDLIIGYQLNLDTHTVQTSIKNYLEEIEKNIISRLEKE